MGGNLFHCPKIGCTPETLRVWGRQHERDTGSGDGGLTSAERQRLKELERENRELRRSNDILRQASAYFAKAEFIDRNLNPKKIKKTPKNGCLFNTACVP